MKYWKTEMVEENEILSDSFQFAAHQQSLFHKTTYNVGSIEK